MSDIACFSCASADESSGSTHVEHFPYKPAPAIISGSMACVSDPAQAKATGEVRPSAKPPASAQPAADR
jgi:hypothetical protein